MAKTNKEEDIETKRKNFIKSREKEIQKIEKKIENINKENKKRKIIKNLKIKQAYIYLSIPFIIVPGFIFSGFGFTKVTPFLTDKDKYYKTWKIDIDCYGNRYEKVEYAKEQKEKDKLYYSSGWYELEDGRYENEKRVYDVENLTNDEVFKLVKDNEVLKLELLEDSLLSSTKTISNTKPEDDLKPSMRAEIYDIDKTDISEKDETERRNKMSTLTYLGMVCVGELLLSKTYAKSDNFKYVKREIEELEEKYKPITDEKYKKRLSILKKNLNLLKRQ